jgi:peptidyl-prolyl cis-trans isomerase SurA
MKKNLLVLLSILLSCFSISIIAAAKPIDHIDHIAAVVNDDVITQSELQQALVRAKTQISQAHLSEPDQSVLHKQVLDKLINQTLQLQLAKTAGIEINDEELEKIITHIAAQNHVTVNELYQRINADGVSREAYREEIQHQVTIQKLQQQEVASKLVIPPDEVNAFIKSRIWQTNTDKEYHLEDILIPLTDNPSSQAITKAKEKAYHILTQIEQGKNFHQLAQSESGNAEALAGGDLGWRKLPEIPTAFTEQVTHMKAKEISGPIQTPNGFHIIRLANVRHLSSHQTPPAHKQIEELLLQQKLEESVQNWLAKLRAQAFISIPTAQA